MKTSLVLLHIPFNPDNAPLKWYFSFALSQVKDDGWEAWRCMHRLESGRAKTGTQTWLTPSSRSPIHKAVLFFLKVRQHFLMPTCSFKRKTISPLLSCESEGGWKGLCPPQPSSLLTHLAEGHGSRSPGAEPGLAGGC